MKLQFDANQQFQLDAIQSVVDLFEGQPGPNPDFAVAQGHSFSELFGAENPLSISDDRLLANTRAVQLRNEIELPSNGAGAPLAGWDLTDSISAEDRSCPHFSIEMETGTGKTYVYLRTIFELAQRYGFLKFIIVVPGVAIREGVLKNIEITAEHFRALYNNLPFEHFVYDAKRINRLRHFAQNNHLQILVINIDAFRKNFMGTDDELKSNVIYRESDRLSGRQPIQFIQSVRPIVIIDEPQSVDNTEKAQEAIRSLNPLLTLRYSATHRNPYNLIYRLDPIKAFQLRLVKQIVVAGARAEGGMNEAFVRVEKIDHQKGIKAKLRIHVQTAGGPKEKSVTVQDGSDLFTLSEERPVYQNGFIVREITAEPGNELVRFQNGTVVRLSEEIGGLSDDIWSVQIRHTLRRHLEKEMQLRGRGIKVLSLFFIDRVSNYRAYDEMGHAQKGKFALELETALREFAKEERYKPLNWLNSDFASLHNGYFSQDKKGVFKDTRGDTQADDDTYNLIMKDKERLLSEEVPLRFIFSHSALREGWDNPNVFQICTLNQTQATMKKRQEIGRGLRLPVDSTGQRVFDESINKLYVIANESYEDFARSLQDEYEEDCGVQFGRVPISAFARLVRVVDGEEVAIGLEGAEQVHSALLQQGMIDKDGRIQASFRPTDKDFELKLPDELAPLSTSVADLLSGYQIERHITREKNSGPNRLLKQIALTPEFKELWERIKPRTRYRIEFATDDLIRRAVDALKRMPVIEPTKIRLSAGRLAVTQAGVEATAESASTERVDFRGPMPDILAYLQNVTELTRSTLVRILIESGRLSDLFRDPQRFLDASAATIERELRRLLVDGIKYERIQGPDSAWEMRLFETEEVVDYLRSLAVDHSLYEYITYDSLVERKFAETLDDRADIKLFVKLPRWFQVDTPLGTYNPDWAIVKHNESTLYLVRETKGTKDFLKLRTLEADKVRCGQKHFEAIGVPFEVAVSADEV